MTAWGVVAVCGIGGGAAGPLLDMVGRHVARPGSPTLATGAPAGSHVPEVAAVSALSAASGALAAARIGAYPALAAYGALFAGLVCVAVADLHAGLVPRRFVYPTAAAVAAGLAASSAASGDWRAIWEAAGCGAAAFVVFAAVWWLWPRGLGFGDVRLAALCGGALGWLGVAPVYLGFLASFVAGIVMGVGALVVAGRRQFPFAPALALGTAFGVLWGGWLGDLWLHPR